MPPPGEIIAWHYARPRERELIVLNIVRDLLTRTISAYFQNVTNPKKAWFLGDRATVEAIPVSALVEKLANHVATDADNVLPWLDRFGGNLSFDPYARPFPKEIGFTTFALPKATVGIVRTENLNAREAELRELFRSARFTIRPRNVSNEKWYGPLYRECLRLYRPSEKVLDLYYNSKLMRHFYSDSEIAAFRSRWSGVSSPACAMQDG